MQEISPRESSIGSIDAWYPRHEEGVSQKKFELKAELQLFILFKFYSRNTNQQQHPHVDTSRPLTHLIRSSWELTARQIDKLHFREGVGTVPSKESGRSVRTRAQPTPFCPDPMTCLYGKRSVHVSLCECVPVSACVLHACAPMCLH